MYSICLCLVHYKWLINLITLKCWYIYITILLLYNYFKLKISSYLLTKLKYATIKETHLQNIRSVKPNRFHPIAPYIHLFYIVLLDYLC